MYGNWFHAPFYKPFPCFNSLPNNVIIAMKCGICSKLFKTFNQPMFCSGRLLFWFLFQCRRRLTYFLRYCYYVHHCSCDTDFLFSTEIINSISYYFFDVNLNIHILLITVIKKNIETTSMSLFWFDWGFLLITKAVINE